MSIKFSTGLRTHMAVTGSLRAALSTCVLKIYAGTEPASADAALGSASLLCEVTTGGDGVTPLTWEPTAADGVLQKETDDIWSGINVATGIAAFFRFETLADAGAFSSSAVRAQGSIRKVTGELNMPSLSLIASEPLVIGGYEFHVADPNFSTGLRNYLAVTGSLRAALSTCVLKIYAGDLPASPDDALGGASMMGLVTTDGDNTTPLAWEATATDGVLTKELDDTWAGIYSDDEVPSFFRYEVLADGDGASTTAIRAQGRIANIQAELNISDLDVENGDPIAVDNFAYAMTDQ